jgi:hypothetical protein
MPRSKARVTVFAIAGALTGVVPLPVVPRRILKRLRGAMAHDVCAGHGLALTTEAREVFAEPSAGGSKPGLGRDAIKWVASRALARVGPYATLVGPVRTAFETLAFGRLLDRYLEKYRSGGLRGHVVRVDGDEARRVREVLDRATMRVIRPGLAAGEAMIPDPPEDYRDSLEKAIDTALIAAARLPEWIAARLDSALDDVMREARDGAGA